MRVFIRCVLFGALAALAPTAGPAQEGKPPAGKAQKYCPIMTQEEIDPESSEEVTYMGVKVYLCCGTCATRFKRDPAAYVDAKLIPALEGKKLPPRGLDQVYCPVYTTWKVSSKDTFTMYKGVKVYLFNDLAKKRFEADPERFAKAEILPQLPKK